ncbi:MAG: tetratricopeptide repeat protein [Treponema sp.]|nr:tetratricopeptide repeat protein [Treponema sp.]
MNGNNPLDTIFFVKLPEDFSFSCKDLKIDREIPLPVQRKDGESGDSIDTKNLSQEQILSGILTVLAYDNQNQNRDYYRSFILQVRPGIKKELGEAAILKTKNEDWDLAEEIWLALHGLDPEDKAITLNMALFFDQKGDSYRKSGLIDDADAYDSTAKAYYRDAMDSDPELPDAFFNAGFFYLKKQDFGEAKGCFESYMALTSDAKDDELGDNGIYKRERAQELIDKISNRNLGDDNFHKAYELINSGKEEEGLDYIRKFLQNNPAVWNAWFMLGWGLRRLERFEDAKQAFLKARECEGGDENADTLNELAICYMETGEIEEAKRTLYDALSIDADNTKIISNLGFLCLKTGEEEQARKFFMTVLEIDPDDKLARMQLEQMEREV